MKTRILFLITLMAMCIQGTAQLNEGYSVVTNSGAFDDDEVVQVFDISAQHTSSTMTLGSNWPWATPTTPGDDPRRITSNNILSWTAEALGQVFGLAINTNATERYIYVSSTQIYAMAGSIMYSPASRYQHYTPSTTPQAGAVLIWQLNPTNGVATALVTASLSDNEPDGYSHNHI